MKENIDFFYRVSKKAGLAEDEDGNLAECYLKMKIKLKNLIGNEMPQMNDAALKCAAGALKIDTSLLTIITEEDYRKGTEDS